MKCPRCENARYITYEKTAWNPDLTHFTCEVCKHRWDLTEEEQKVAREADRVSRIDAVAAAENELIAKMVKVVGGYVPGGTKDLLHVLLHPDILPLTEAYISAWKKAQF